MAYNIKVQAFEGPFDLLFHLIEKNEIDLYDIPINQVTEQYIQYIRSMEELDLEVTSEFLVMAATLLEIKSKMLLPVEVVEDQQLEFEDIDPRSELVRKLLEYKKYKLAAEAFKDREDFSSRLYFKPREEFIPETDEFDKLLDNLEMKDLLLALQKALKGKHQGNTINTTIRQLQRDSFTIEDKINALLEMLDVTPNISFSRLFQNISTRNEIITTFLALLELIKLKHITVKQDECFTDISIEKRINYLVEVFHE